jgi:hypothetical protein
VFWVLHPSVPGALNLIDPDPTSFATHFHRFPAQNDPLNDHQLEPVTPLSRYQALGVSPPPS